MRTILIATAAFGAALLLDPRPAPAAEMPWCGVIALGTASAYWDCRYRSIEECRPNVLAGNRGYCSQNPAYDWTAAPAQKPRRKARNR